MRRLLHLLLPLLLWAGAATATWGQIQPIAYWTFDGTNPWADASVNGFDINQNTLPGLIQGNLGIVGNHLHGEPFPVPYPGFPNPSMAIPYLSTVITDSLDLPELSYEVWFRPDKYFHTGYLVDWKNVCSVFLSEYYFLFEWQLDGGVRREEYVYLYGNSLTDAAHLLDGNWHHLAFTYTPKTGTARAYFDGQSNPALTWHSGPSAGLNDQGGVFYPMTNLPTNRVAGNVDELALYDTVIPPQMVWQHYQDGLAQQHYSFLPSYAGVVIPPAPNNQVTATDPMEFAPGYPHVPYESWALLDSYPDPRYRIGHTLPLMIPWLADNAVPAGAGKLSETAGLSPPSPTKDSAISRRLAEDWNFYYFLGFPSEYRHGNIFSNSSERTHYLLRGAAFGGYPTFLLGNWHNCDESILNPAGQNDPFATQKTLPDSFYFRNAAGVPIQFWNGRRWHYASTVSPSPVRRNGLQHDGFVQAYFLEQIKLAADSLGLPVWISMFGENDETFGATDPADVVGIDAELTADFATSGYTQWDDYMADRAFRMRQLYRDPWRDYQNTQNILQGRDSIGVYWYNVGGFGLISQFAYGPSRHIGTFRDGRIRGTDYIYPQFPYYWRAGLTNATGLDQILNAREVELPFGDPFMPSVSAGYNGQSNRAPDQLMFRPGQYLGLLKGLNMLGADSYAAFMYDDRTNYDPGNYRIWQVVTPAYAQGVGSRMADLLYGAQQLTGDQGNYIIGGRKYSYSTGNGMELVIARKANNAPRYGISASLMRQVNYIAHGDIEKDICFQFHDDLGNAIIDSMQLKARLQGSTYLLDLSNGDTLFYQLDGWHEWSDPFYWCRDYVLEAELWDTVLGSASLHTSWPPGRMPSDFRDWTTYARAGQYQDTLKYSFTVRHPDQDKLWLWVRARTDASVPQLLGLYLDGVGQGGIPISGNSFTWHRLAAFSNQPMLFGGLALGQHTLGLVPGPDSVEIDKVLLLRQPDDFITQPFQITAIATDSVHCFGDSVAFKVVGGLPVGCVEYTWDFGDGIVSHAPAPSHLYVRADSFLVTVTVEHPCLGQSRTDSIWVWARGPHVEAGPDRVVCLGDTVQMLGSAGYFSKWREDSVLSSPIVGDPFAWPSQSGYLHIESWDPLSGCYNIDSAYVSVLSLEDVRGIDQWVCLGNVATLNVHGGYDIWWAPDSLLSNDTIRNPQVLVTDTTVFTAYVRDFCRCDTDTVQVWVYPYILTDNEAWTDRDTICHLDTVHFFQSGFAQQPRPQWQPPTYLDDPRGMAPTAVLPQYTQPYGDSTTTYTYAVNGVDCNGNPITDTVQVVVIQPPTLENWRDTVYQCNNFPTFFNPTLYPAASPAAAWWHWSPGHIFSDSTIRNPSALVTAPTLITLEIGSFRGCPATYSAWLLPAGIQGLPDTVWQCPGGSVALYANTQGLSASAIWTPAAFCSPPNALHTTVSLPASGQVNVTVSTGLCTTKDKIEVVVRGIPEIVGPDTLRGCPGDTLPLQASGANPVVWWGAPPATPPGGLAVGDSTAALTWTILQGQPFTVYVASCDSFFCPGFDSVLVTWRDAILADTLTICHGDTVAIPVLPGGVSCTWTPSATLGGSPCAPLAFPLASTMYHLSWTDAAGCLAYDSVWVKVDSSCCHIPGAQKLDGAFTSALGSSFVYGGRYLVRDTLTVDLTQFFRKTVFEMEPGAVVRVLPGMVLDVDSSIFRSSCGLAMWKTVLLEPGSALKSRHNTYRDAETGITSVGGGDYGCDFDTFLVCNRGVRVEPFAGLHSGSMTGCVVRGGPMLPPHQLAAAPLAGLDAEGVVQLGQFLDNHMEGLHYGVRVKDCGVLVSGSTFSDLVNLPGTNVSACGIHAEITSWGAGRTQVGELSGGMPVPGRGCRFARSEYGVYHQGPSDVEVYGSVFDTLAKCGVKAIQQSKNRCYAAFDTLRGCHIGVYAGLGRNVHGHIRRNVITGGAGVQRTGVWADGISYDTPPPAKMLVEDNAITLQGDGIRGRVCDGMEVLYNDVEIIPFTLAGFARNHGVLLEGTEGAKVKENQLHSDPGNLPAGRTHVRGIWVVSSPETEVLCNDVTAFGWGIGFHSPCNDSRLRYNRIIGAVDGLVLEDDGRIGQQGDPFDPTDNIWYGGYSHGQTLSKASFGIFSPIYARVIGIGGGVVMPTINLVTVGSSPVRFDTVTSPKTAMLAQCVDKAKDPDGEGLRFAVGADTGAYKAWPAENNWRDQAWAYGKLLADPGLLRGDSILQTFWDNADSSSLGSLVQAGAAVEAESWRDAERLVERAVATNLVEANLQQVQAARIGFERQALPLDTATLYPVARQCPDQGGPAVHLARMLLLSVTGQAPDDVECTPPPSGARMKGEQSLPNPAVEAWPNPASASLNFRLVGGGAGTIQVFDMRGVLLASMRLLPDETASLDVGAWAEGIYAWRFVPDAGGSGSSGRVAVIH